MALRPLKLLYTGVWAAGYSKHKHDFLRLTMKNINLTVFTDNTFALKVLKVNSEGLTLAPFCISGKAQILYNPCGDVDEILISELSHDGNVIDDTQIYSISKTKCTRLPIPNGEAFFCFSSRLPSVDFRCFETVSETESPKEDFSYDDPMPSSSLDEMDFDEVFDSFMHQS